MDIVSGPFIFLGPDFAKEREFYLAHPTVRWISRRTGSSSPATLQAMAGPTCSSRQHRALVVCQPERRIAAMGFVRGVVPPAANVSEVSVMKDIDADGKPDLCT